MLARSRTDLVTVGPMQVASLPGLLRAIPSESGTVVVRDGLDIVVATRPTEITVADGSAAFEELDRVENSGGWWSGYLAYDLGRSVEPVETRADDDRSLPDLVLARFDARLLIHPDGSTEVIGDGEARDDLTRAVWQGRRPVAPIHPRARSWSTSIDREEHAVAQRRIHDHLDAGNCYQVNLTRRLTHDRAVDPVALFVALAELNPSPHACLLRFGTRGPAVAVVGASPELFLRVDGSQLTTRPIKGTHRDAEALVTSTKDAAEHIMIVDLARNDLGRVCIPGSVRVPELMAVESHPGLHHMVSTVVGERRAEVGLGRAIRALFPAASITGAPKPAVMQIIEDLEPIRRGVYCGATGWIDASNARGLRAEFAVAIRTFTITARHTDLGVGGGIVADSSDADEWHETELKAHRLLAAAGGLGSEATTATR
jgi:para-aminobenzoate synthetase component I